MTNEHQRVGIATLLRGLGHDFVARDLSDEQLAAVHAHLEEIRTIVNRGTVRTRSVPPGSLKSFKLSVPEDGQVEKHQLFSDSIVSGGANPMGLGGYLWREGSHAMMEVTLGKAFEGAPGRAHGGIVAALIDETMGLVLAINEVLAFTAQLDITFIAPTPLNTPIIARAWLDHQDGRKLSIAAVVKAGDTEIAKAEALFISVDPEKFLKHLASLDS